MRMFFASIIVLCLISAGVLAEKAEPGEGAIIMTEPDRDSAAAPAETAGLPADAEVDQVLDALHAVGQDLQGFDADVELTETDAIMGLATARMGRVWYQSFGDGQARLRVTFDRRESGGAVREERVEYLLAEGWLVDRDYRRRIEVNRQVLRPGERIDLLKLGEGPFPLPIGQEKQEVHRLFEVQKHDPAEDDPPETIRLELIPRAGTDLARKFDTIDVWVDRRTHMPRRIETIDVNQVTITTTDLDNIRGNPRLTDADFALPPIGRDWSRHDEPFVD